MSKRNRGGEVDGNALASAQAVTRALVRFGELVSRFERAVQRMDEEDIIIRSFRVKLPDGENGTYMLVVSADTPDGAKVGFQSGETLLETLQNFTTKLENRSIKWQIDKFKG